MKTEIKNIIELISKTENGRYKKYLPEKDNFEIKTFESTQEHILDIYKTRQQIINQQGKNILGLNEFIDNLKKIKINTIKTTLFNKENDKFVIFTDQYYNQLIGFLLLSKIVNEK